MWNNSYYVSSQHYICKPADDTVYDIDSSFIDAARIGDVQSIKKLSASGVLANSYDENQWQALHFAVFKMRYDCVETLLTYEEVNVNLQTDDLKTPLALACGIPESSMPFRFVHLLLKHGADPNIADKYGFTPLHKAVISGCRKSISLLLENGANVNAQNEKGNTPLHYTGEWDMVEIAKILLKSGADTNIVNKSTKTPVWVAMRQHAHRVFRLFVKHYGTDLSICRNDKGYNILSVAVMHGCYKESALILMEENVNWNIFNNDNTLPLHAALKYYADDKVMKHIIKTGIRHIVIDSYNKQSVKKCYMCLAMEQDGFFVHDAIFNAIQI